MSQHIVPQPVLSRALQRRLSTPAGSGFGGHDFDVISDPPPAPPAQEAEKASDAATESAQTK
jgi:hypothetical protein